MRGRVVLTNPLVDLSFLWRFEWLQNAQIRCWGYSATRESSWLVYAPKI